MTTTTTKIATRQQQHKAKKKQKSKRNSSSNNSSSSEDYFVPQPEWQRIPCIKRTPQCTWPAERPLLDRARATTATTTTTFHKESDWIAYPRDELVFSDEALDNGARVASSLSGRTVTSDPWTPQLLATRYFVEAACPTTHHAYCGEANDELHGQRFNMVLVSRLRNGADHIGWHHDKDEQLVTPVGSLSLGATRIFQFREAKWQWERRAKALSMTRGDNAERQARRFTVRIPLPDNCCVVFNERANKRMEHRVPRQEPSAPLVLASTLRFAPLSAKRKSKRKRRS
jgi:hypothetical protein